MLYSTIVGGADYDSGHGIVVDGAGNAYVTGETRSADFPNMNAPYPRLRGYRDAFVFKLNPQGKALVYSTYLGGSASEEGNGIAVDSGGSVYVTGETSSSGFPTRNAPYPELRGSSDAFVSKFNTQGTAVAYSSYLGGSDYDEGYGIVVGATGVAYVTGETGSNDFPTQGAPYPRLRGYKDGFVSKLNPIGGGPIYSTYFGGSSFDNGRAIAVDAAGSVYVTLSPS